MEQQGSKRALEQQMQSLLDRRKSNCTLRGLTLPQLKQTDFSSNDFLSLATSPHLRTAFLTELNNTGVALGSSGSRLLDGNSSYATDLENVIANFHGAEAGLLFNSGFDANAGFFACVPQPGDVIIYDELVHASVHDGMRLSRARRTIPFDHNSTAHLRKILQDLVRDEPSMMAGQNVLIALEAIYSMDGDVAPLQDIVRVVNEELGDDMGYIVVDEAHSTGVLGPKGSGLVCELGLESRIFARLHTFGKSLAGNGGMVVASTFVNDSRLTGSDSDLARLPYPAAVSHQLCSATDLHNVPLSSLFGANPIIIQHAHLRSNARVTVAAALPYSYAFYLLATPS